MKKILGKIYSIKKTLFDQGGFSLTELLSAIFAFSIIALVIGTIFTQVMAMQRRGYGAQKVQESITFALELMAREIRVSTVQSSDADCSVPANFADRLMIDHPDFSTVEYSLVDLGGTAGFILREEGVDSAYITSGDVIVTNLAFCIYGSAIDGEQARVAVLVTAENKTKTSRDKVVVSTQTTIAIRDLIEELTN
jgi:prepilin-type N-terminal cleavage/methylation domain-containing protein